jgi:histidinol-phosphate phosphatase family protein
MTELLDRPRQAVILAGGRGTRLRPLTDSRPKPMIEFHGKPFLRYIIEMLRDQGYTRILLLLGYLPDVIRQYFGDGRELGVEIEYRVTDPDDLTARRLRLAAPLLDDCFLLLYCDNYWPMQMECMWDRFKNANVTAMVTIYRNRDSYSKDCVRVGLDGLVEHFDRSRRSNDLAGVEISYTIIRKSAIALLTRDDLLFEEAVYPSLAQQRQLLAYQTDHRYYSVGSPERLAATECFLARRPTVILDRDGVLNHRPAQAEYIRNPEQFSWLPGAKDALKLFKDAGYRVIVASNQAGIARGHLTQTDLTAVHARMRQEAAMCGGDIDAVYYCPHNWHDGCECRKPQPGMLFQAQREFHLDLSRTYFLGDDERDEQAARAAGCKWALVSKQATLLQHARVIIAEQALKSGATSLPPTDDNVHATWTSTSVQGGRPDLARSVQ